MIASSCVADCERGRERVGVGLGGRGGVGRGHDRDVHALGPERVGGEAGHERRVDPAREAQHHAGEPVLLHVVAQAEFERRVHLGLDRRELRARGVLIPEGVDGRQGSGRRRRAVRRRRRVADRRKIEVADEHILRELSGARDRGAGRVEHEGVAVEHELVLAAD